MAHLTDLDLTAPADSLFSGGTVLNTWRTRIDALNDVLGDITAAEANQVENIAATTISAAQWAYLGALDQSIISTASVDFGEVDITKTTTLAAGGFGLRCQVTHSTTGMTGTLRGAYIVATNAAFTATGVIRGAEIKSRAATSGDVGGNVTTLEGVSISSDAKNKTVTTQRGMEVILDGKSGAAVTLGVGIRIANNYQANLATTSYALQIYRDSFDYTADIQLSGGGLIGGSTGKIKMDSSGVTTLTASANLDIGSYNFRAATLTADGLTSGRVVFASTSGLLIDDSDFTFATDTLTVTKIAAFTLMGKLTAGASEIEGTAFDINGGTMAGITLDGAIAGGDQAFTGVGDMTFTAGSILAAAAADTSTLLIKAGGLAGTAVITITSLDAGDTLGLANITSLVASGNLDIGAHGFTANTLTADGLTATRVVFAGTGGLLSASAAMTFVTDTLTVTKLGAFEATGAINFGNQNMTNVDIDSGAIDGVTIGGAAAPTVTNLGAVTTCDINGGTIGGVTLDGAITMSMGSDVDGDIYIRSSNVLTRVGAGTEGHVLTMGASLPAWAAATGGVDTSGTPVDNDFAKFTDADTIEGRSYSETVSDLSVDTRRLFNLCRNAAFASRSGGTSAVPDEWVLELTPTVAYDTVDVSYGDYAVKLTATGAGDEGINQTLTHLKISTKYQVFARVKVDAGDTASLITTGATTNINADSTSATWENITGEFVTDASGTDVVIKLVASADTDVAYFCGITCVEGAIPPANFIRRVDEIIYLRSPLLDNTNWDDTAYSSSEADIDLSSFGNGCPPKIKAVLITAVVKDSDSASTNTYLIMGVGGVALTTDTMVAGIKAIGVPNDTAMYAPACWIPCDTNGDIRYAIAASGTNTFDAHLTIWGYVLG